MRMKEITGSTYWDKRTNELLRRALPIEVYPKPYLYKRFHEIFMKLFKKFDTKGKTLIEVGCTPGRWLIYFAKYHGFRVYGIDYSKIGCALTRQNFALSGVEGNVIEADFLTHKFYDDFDVVFSHGFIEHFEDPKIPLLKMRRILKPGGFLITDVPNFESPVYRALQVLADREALATHKVITKEAVQTYLTEIKLRNIHTQYFGTFNLRLIDWGLNAPFYKQFLNQMTRYVNYGITRTLDLTKVCIESRFLSPYIIGVGNR